MKTIRQIVLVSTLALGMASCSKNNSTPTPTPVDGKTITITDLKALSTGSSVKIPDNTKFSGIVISDVSNKNIDPKTVVFQEAAGKSGIVVTFNTAQTFALGDQVEVNISNQTLAKVNGETALTDIPAANAKKTGTGSVAAAVTNAADVVKNAAALDGTLVSIPIGGITGGNGNFSGTLTATDSTGTVSSVILAGAAFENTAYPALVKSLTGIVRISGTAVEIDIRKAADISSAISRTVTEDFTNVTGTIFPSGALDVTTFTTAVSSWYPTTGPAALLPGSTYDADFTTAGRKYIYMEYGAGHPYTDINGNQQQTQPGQLTNTAGSGFSGLKTVTITFAASKMNGNMVFPNGASDLDSVAAFNPAKDIIQIGFTPNFSSINPDFNYEKLNFYSTQYNQTGKFYTVTWTLPTKAQFAAAGAVADDDYAITQFAAIPNFIINNLCTRKDATGAGIAHAPIIIDKVVFGF